MDKYLFDRVVQMLLPEMENEDARRELIRSALYGSPALDDIDWRGGARTFTVRLVHQLNEYGEIAPGKRALVALLSGHRAGIGTNRQANSDALIAELTAPPVAPAVAPPVTPPTPVFSPDALYVFISYARPDQEAAEQVEAFLKASGVRVFRDTSDIREGANWDMTIETALRETDRMVLLLSAASMPYRKEVHREWFYFDQTRKPIYPLYIQACDLHSRLYAYNYIDAQTDRQVALDRLLAALGRDFDAPAASVSADQIGVFDNAPVETRTLPEALQALLDAIRDPAGSVVLSVEQAQAVADHKPVDLTEYRLGRIAEWSLPRYALDNRFVNLTLLLDKGETDPQRWQRAEDYRFNDLRTLLDKVPERVLVVLGAPGSGKSTLLRRLQLDHSIDRLRDDGPATSFFVPLNGYRARADGVLLDPRPWLEQRWSERYPHLPPLDAALNAGKVLLLLDALNEMPHKSIAEYYARVALWRAFAQEAAQLGNRLIFSCRKLDYSAMLSSPELRVPQIEVQPMDAAQVRAFLKAYIPAREAQVWHELDGSPQFGLFQTPYFLKLLCDQVESNHTIPKGRASLFTGFVRQVLYRELNGDLFQPDTLLSEKDHQKLALGKWRSPFELPERGILFPTLSALAFAMQQKGLESEEALVRIDYDDACDLIDHERADDILKAGTSLSVLDEDVSEQEVTFFHQLLQEFFAARKLADAPNPALVHVEWAVDRVKPTLAEALAGLADGDPLPPLPQTGWEETTLTAAPMAKDPSGFIRDLIAHNLPLAARCAASGEIAIDPDLKHNLQMRLIARTQDMTADLRARIAAGEALGVLGDPRFERRTGPFGDYLLPPLVLIVGGTYPIGDDDSPFDFEKPAHTVDLAPFQIGAFPVTNAEYALFMEAGGYEDERWWETEEAKAWRRGEGNTEGQKADTRDLWNTLQSVSDNQIRGLVKQNRITSEQANQWIAIRNLSRYELERLLEVVLPSGKVYREPDFWNDASFNNPAQPVVGVTWFEARAYCAWLSAQTGRSYRLPTDVEFEAAARGTAGRAFAYGEAFDAARCNTFESHLRRSTPVGIFDNATPEGAFDLAGNVLGWTTTIYAQEEFPCRYQATDGREDVNRTNVQRVLRGGSWFNNQNSARAVFRSMNNPYVRSSNYGFRVVVEGVPI